jgi:hypothetical protein
VHRKFSEAKAGLVLNLLSIYVWLHPDKPFWCMPAKSSSDRAGIVQTGHFDVFIRPRKNGQGTMVGLQQAMGSFSRSIVPLLPGWLFLFMPAASFICSLLVSIFNFSCLYG